jgi:hypothetical protein
MTEQEKIKGRIDYRDDKIHAAIAAVMSEIGAISKDRKNQQQGFMFRGIDQAYNAIHPLMAKHQVFTVPRVLELISRTERQTARGGVLFVTLLKVEYDFISGVDGSKITVGPIIGEGMDSGDKGTNKALAIAHKYALFQTFLIPTEKTDDPDAESHTDIVPEASDGLDDWGDAEPDTPPAPPAQKAVKKKAASKKKATTKEAAPDADDMSPFIEIDSEDGAKFIAQELVKLADMHSDSLASLKDFWMKNARPLQQLDEQYPEIFSKVKKHFTKLKEKLQGD